MVELVYEDEHLRALWHEGASDYLLITFGDLTMPAEGLRFYAEGPVEKLGLTCLGIMAKAPNWYPQSSVKELAALLLERMARFGERILHGSSMGGYGAIKSSKTLRATTTIAFCPQWTLDLAECSGFSPGWQEYFRPEYMKGMSVKSGDIGGKIFVFSDPYNPIDEFHRRMLSLAGPIISMPVFSCDHNISPVFAGTQNLKDIVSCCRARSLPQLQRLINRLRKHHYYRKEALIRRGMRLKPRLTARAISRLSPIDGHISFIAENLASRVIGQLSLTAEIKTLKSYVLVLVDAQKITMEKMKKSLLLAQVPGLSARLKTIFGTYVYYDTTTDAFFHSGDIKPAVDSIPVQVFVRNNSLELFLSSEVCRLTITPDHKTGALSFTPQEKNEFKIEDAGDGFVYLEHESRYLNAEPNGSITGNRLVPSEWEKFSIDLVIVKPSQNP